MRHAASLRWLATLALSLVPPMQAHAQTTEYGKAGPWSLLRTVEAGQVVACHATMFTGSELGMIFDYNLDQTSIGFMGPGSGVAGGYTQVEIWFDNNHGEAMMIEAPHEGDWRVYRTSNSEPDGLLDSLANRSSVSFRYLVPGYGEQVVRFPLNGSNAMTKQTYACVQNAQTFAPPPPAPVAMPMPAPAPAPVVAAGQPQVIFGTCKLVVQGTTYIDLRGNCPIWLANDGTGTFWINVDRNAYLGQYFATIEPQGNGIGWGHWNGMPGATHAQALLGEDFRMAANGCWINATAMVCASQ